MGCVYVDVSGFALGLVKGGRGSEGSTWGHLAQLHCLIIEAVGAIRVQPIVTGVWQAIWSGFGGVCDKTGQSTEAVSLVIGGRQFSSGRSGIFIW